MNLVLWIFQAFVALTFLYSGICKTCFSEQKLVAMGQTGVEGLPLLFTRFIGLSEILGAVGLIVPWLLSIYPILTPVAALCLGFIMPFAAAIHYRRKEYKSVLFNCSIFLLCLLIAYGRMFLLSC
jgi:hypothetical protein